MEFPSFGDAASYEQLGRACAIALRGDGGSPFDACYHPVRPVGAALFMAGPHLIAPAPFYVDYVALLLNVALFALAVVALTRMLVDDRALLQTLPARQAALGTLAFSVLLLNLVSHIPIRLADLPSWSLFLGAMAVGSTTLSRDLEPATRRRRYCLAGILAAAAALLKVSLLPFSLVLLVAMLSIDSSIGARARMRCAAAFLLGFSPVALQFANVWAHTGDLWFYDRAYMQANFSYPGREWGVEGVIHMLPEPGAYVTHVTVPISYPTLWALRLYSGLFHFEWAVYHGEAWRGRLWELSSFELATAWLVVLSYLGLTGWEAWRASTSLRLLNATSLGVSLITAVFMHTEPRYYAFSRAVLWVTVACLCLRGLQRVLRGVSPSTSAPA